MSSYSYSGSHRKSRSRSFSGSRRRRSKERRENSRENGNCRVHIADLSDRVTQYDIEKIFMKFGKITEVWMAKNPPCFAFCVFENKYDAADAVNEMNNKYGSVLKQD